MSAKIIFLPTVYDTTRQLPLSGRMVDSLVKACEKQHAGIPFGQEIGGSFVSLTTRGLIARNEAITSQNTQFAWQVTTEAIKLLKSMGIEVAC